MQACSPKQNANEARKEAPYEESINWRRLRWYLITAYKMSTGGLNIDHSLFFVPRPCLSGHSFKACQGPSLRLRRKSAFSILAVKHWNGLPTSILTALSVNSFKRQLDSALEELFAEFPWFPILQSPLPTPITQSPFTLSPFKLSQPLIHCYSWSYYREKIVMHHSTLPICSYRDPLWPTLPLNIIIINLYKAYLFSMHERFNVR